MNDDTDFPTCRTCDYFHPPTLHCPDGVYRGLCEKEVGTGTEDHHTHPFFGCILHSDLDADTDE